MERGWTVSDEPDRVVLNYWDGRPTLWLSTDGGTPVLHWLVTGYTESFSIWLETPLSWDEADRFSDNPPLNVSAYFSERGGHPATLRMRAPIPSGTEILLSTHWTIPHTKSLVLDALRAVRDALNEWAEEQESAAVEQVEDDLERVLTMA